MYDEQNVLRGMIAEGGEDGWIWEALSADGRTLTGGTEDYQTAAYRRIEEYWQRIASGGA
jgi:hypothetical protein